MQITGKATIKLDGEELLTEAAGTLNVGGVEREPVNGPRGVQGYRESPTAPTLQVNVRHTEDTDLLALARIRGASVLFETDTGDAYLLRKAFVTEPPELAAGDGNVQLNMSAHGIERV